MKIYDSIDALVGNTPLVEIKNIENDQINLYNIKLDENIELENIE